MTNESATPVAWRIFRSGRWCFAYSDKRCLCDADKWEPLIPLAQLAAIQSQLDAKTRECEALRTDAERLNIIESFARIGEIHVDGEIKDCVMYAISGVPGLSLREILDAIRAQQGEKGKTE